MFRLLPWSSAIGGNKVMAEEVKMLAPSNCTIPGVNGLSLSRLKRKRSDSDATDTPAATKMRTESTVASVLQASPTVAQRPAGPIASPSTASSTPVATASVAAQDAATALCRDVNKLRDTITAQLSLEVLLKHNELRLIDQEIAKCQVALEQLRRCAEMPYPGSRAAGMSSTVSSGTGAAVWAPGNGPPPLSPAPWGITEGPYSRHYARWLLPDPRFDGGDVDSGFSAVTGSGTPLVEGRSTRGNPSDAGWLAGKARPQRGSMGTKLQALPSGYPVVKEKAGPMLIRRKSDGVLVKLICLDCRRDNFSSTQGFINHCRIAHNRNFASHDAAAMASGEPVEVDEAGTVVGGRSESTSSTACPGYVHPLIRSAHFPAATPVSTPTKDSTPVQKPSDPPSAVATPPASKPAVRQASSKSSAPSKISPNPAFLASPATPHLSALMQDRGVGVDLDRLVGEARTPVDLGAFSSEDEDDSDVQDSERPSSERRASRQPMRMPVAQAASSSGSRKGVDRAAHAHALETTPSHPQPRHEAYLSEVSLSVTSQPSQAETPCEVDGMDHAANLSPNTIESNQAPSLVSDDEDDYEAASESDAPSSSEAGDHDQEFSHIEVQDDERTAAPSSTAAAEAKPGPSLAGPGPPPAPTLSKPLKRSRPKKISSIVPSFNNDKDDKRVNLVHPTGDNPVKPKRGTARKPAPSQG